MTTEGTVAASSARLRDLWSRGRPAYGLWSSLTDTTVAELLAGAPFDYTCVDLQHGRASFSELPGMLQAMRGGGSAPLVRVPWNEPVWVMRALDSGAAGVVVPMVDSAEHARKAASACRYPPAGSRSWGPMWGDVRPDGALPPEQQDASAICLVMVETAAAVDALPEIVGVPGIDGVYVGPNDLALSCGHGRATFRDSAEVERLVQRIVTACRDAGVVAGLHCSDPEMAAYWAERGATMLTTGTDITLLRSAVRTTWAFLEDAGAVAR